MPVSDAVLDKPFAFRSFRAILAVVGINVLAAAGSYAPVDRPLDVDSMASAQPLPKGDPGTTTSGPGLPGDTGDMAHSEPMRAGVAHRAVAPRHRFDTGSMVFPVPFRFGNGSAIQVK